MIEKLRRERPPLLGSEVSLLQPDRPASAPAARLQAAITEWFERRLFALEEPDSEIFERACR